MELMVFGCRLCFEVDFGDDGVVKWGISGGNKWVGWGR